MKLLSRITLSLLLATTSLSAAEIYVSPTGDDTNNGSKESPLRSVAAAQVAARKLVAGGADEDITITLREGRHQIDKTICLTFEDLAVGRNLTIKSFEGEEAMLSSGVNITGWSKLTEYPAGTPDVAKGNLYVADMPDGLGSFRTLFDGDKLLTRARSAEFKMEPLNTKLRRAASRNVEYHKDRIALREFPFDDQIKDWDNLGDVELFFNPVPWALNFIAIDAVDMERKIAYLKFESNSIPFLPHEHQRFAWVENIIDYLDEPGEWCVDTKQRKIYYWSKGGAPSENILAPQLMEMIRVEGKIRYDMPTDIAVKNIHFKGLTFSHGDRSVWYKDRKGWGIQHDWDTFDYGNAMLRFRGAEECSVEECKFVNSGGSAMRLDLHAQKIHIFNNYIADVGHMGILLCGYGPGTKYANKENIIENNIITRVGQIIWHGHAIFAWQSGGNRFAHNYIHDVPRKAIGLCGVRCYIQMKPDCNFDEASQTIRWSELLSTLDETQLPIHRYAKYLHSRDNVIEDNFVFKTLQKLSDGAAINVSGAGTGNIVRHNFFTGGSNFRTDDWQDGTTLINNIFYKAGAIVHKGNNTVKNNMHIDCGLSIRFRLYPGQDHHEWNSDIVSNIFYNTSEKYTLNTTESFAVDRDKSNIKTIPYLYNMDYNVYYFKEGESILKLHQENGIAKHTIVADPQFEDVENYKFKIGNKGLIKSIGFKEFDTSISSFGITSEYPAKFRALDPSLKVMFK